MGFLDFSNIEGDGLNYKYSESWSMLRNRKAENTWVWEMYTGIFLSLIVYSVWMFAA